MGSRCDTKRVNEEEDRLSSLPDELIHKILSFVSIKLAVQTSVLSSRWRYIWTSISCLNFSCKDFHTLPKFSKFVEHVLSGRDNQIEVSSIELTSRGKVIQGFVKRILNYAFSHNVQQMNITCLPENKIEFPLSLFSSQSLKNLTLIGCTHKLSITTPPTWELQSLATLNIHCVSLYDNNTDNCASFFSNFANLKNLTLKSCKMMCGLNGFNICHPRLSNLTLEDCQRGGNVVTPQLKNLIVKRSPGIHLISAPNLSSLHCKDYNCPLQFSGDLFHLEKVDICLSHPTNAHKVVCRLQQFRSVKFLTLNSEIVKLLSSSVELISHQPSPFVNLKNVKIYPNFVDPMAEKRTQPEVTLSTEVKNYFLNSSPGATFTIVSHEEVRTAMNVTLAQNLMSKLKVLLNQWKENCETAHMKQSKAPIEKIMAVVPGKAAEVENRRTQLETKIKRSFGERMTHINDQFKKGYKNTSRTVSMLRDIHIEEILTRLPASRRAKLQLSFSNLCVEAETVMDNMVNYLKIQCDKKPGLHFPELTAASQPRRLDKLYAK